MKSVALLSIAFALVGSFGFAEAFRPRGNVKTPEWWINATARATHDASQSMHASAAFPPGGIVIPIRWTLVLPGSKAITKARIAAQLKVLNQKFAPIKVQFKTHSIVTRRYNKQCTDDFHPDVTRFVDKYPSTAVYNIVICPMPSNFGVAMLTTDDTPHMNSMVLHPDSFPDKSSYLGYTAVHEMGHTFGLNHVFNEDNSCARDSDGVRDTPIQSTPTQGCPKRKDSCPGKPGVDSVHNFLDYSDDACMRGFTRGQHALMRSWIANYKPSFLKGSGGGPGKPPFALNAYSFKLKIVGRSNCPGYLTAGSCEYAYLSGTPGDSSYWYAPGAWSKPTDVLNYAADSGCDALSYDDTGFATTDSSTLWVVEWLGNNQVRIGADGYFLGASSDCNDEFVGLYEKNSGEPITWTIEQ